MAIKRFKKAQRKMAIDRRVEELLIDHRGFSMRKLRSIARQWVEHHYGKRATKEYEG